MCSAKVDWIDFVEGTRPNAFSNESQGVKFSEVILRHGSHLHFFQELALVGSKTEHTPEYGILVSLRREAAILYYHTMIDTNTAKQLLQSSDVTLLKSSLKDLRNSLDEDQSIDDMMRLQLIKLNILLYNRLLQIQTADSSTSKAELAVTYAGIAGTWNLMDDGEKCQGQLTKSFGCDPNCIEALILQSEVHSNQARYDSAIADLQKVVSILKEKKDGPKYGLVEAYLKLSAVHEMRGSFEDAIAVLKDAIKEFSPHKSEDTTQSQLIKIELYGRLGTIQDKLAMYGDAVDSLSIAVAELKKCHGDKHAKTQEMEYILEMATSAKNG